MVNPIPNHEITTPFGVPGSWAWGSHTGADIAADENTGVFSATPGVVVETGVTSWGDAYGDRSVIVETPDGVHILYAHLNDCYVGVGQEVQENSPIGIVGQRGRAFGPHLHFEARTSPYGYGSDCFDPAPYCVNPPAPPAPTPVVKPKPKPVVIPPTIKEDDVLNIFVTKFGAANGSWYAQFGDKLVPLRGAKHFYVRPENRNAVNIINVSDEQFALIVKALPIVK